MTIRSVVYHPIFILIVTVIAIMFFFSLDKSGKKTQKSAENIRILEYEVNQISNDIINLEEKIENTQTEQFKEKVVRNELLMQKPGEYVMQINQVDEDLGENGCDSSDCQENVNNSKTSNFSAWRDLLF